MLENELKDLKLKKKQIHFLLDCIELDIPNILAPYEIYMLKIHEGDSQKEALEDFKETLKICLKQYHKEIRLLEQAFYSENK